MTYSRSLLTTSMLGSSKMGDGFRGVSVDQDGRFKSQEKKLFAKMKFPPQFATKVDMRKVHLEVLRPWVTKKVTQVCERPFEYFVGRLSCSWLL